MKPEEFKDWYEVHHAKIDREIEYKGLIGALHYVYEAAVRETERQLNCDLIRGK